VAIVRDDEVTSSGVQLTDIVSSVVHSLLSPPFHIVTAADTLTISAHVRLEQHVV